MMTTRMRVVSDVTDQQTSVSTFATFDLAAVR
jgi:hypothetical protein